MLTALPLVSSMTGAPPPPPVKVCSCGRPHTVAGWKALRFVGVWDVGGGERYELRDCICESTTLALPLVEEITSCR